MPRRSFLRDFLVRWLENRPEAWATEAVTKLKVPISTFQKLSEGERARFVVTKLRRSLGVDLGTGVGRIAPLLDIFRLAPRIGSTLRKALHELSQIRNIVVHAGSRADKRFLDQCPWLPYSVGQEVTVSHALYGWYHQAARRYTERILNSVVLAYGFAGCKCPGMDDLPPRPTDGPPVHTSA